MKPNKFVIPVLLVLLTALAIVLINYQMLTASTGNIDQQLRRVIEEANLSPMQPHESPDPALVALGEALFFDRELSGNRDISCATCHHPTLHTGDGIPLSIGVGGEGLGLDRMAGAGRPFVPRNAPDIFNRGMVEWQTMFWDSRVHGTPQIGFVSPAGDHLPAGLDNLLAVQAMFPVTSRDEMRGEPGDLDVLGQPNELALISDEDFPGIWAALQARLMAHPAYLDLFQAAYPDSDPAELGFQHAANAIAAFELEAWTFYDSPWDAYLRGDNSALSPSAKRGAILFYGEAGCSQCHSGSLMTDQAHHNLAVPQLGPGKDPDTSLDTGRYRITSLVEDRFAFRTPPLRNVTLTGPWMHNGAYASLEAAVIHHLDPQTALETYDVSQLPPALLGSYQTDPAVHEALLVNLDPMMSEPVELSEAEIQDLLNFLEALTDPAAINLDDDIPLQVPSGLPVDGKNFGISSTTIN